MILILFKQISSSQSTQNSQNKDGKTTIGVFCPKPLYEALKKVWTVSEMKDAIAIATTSSISHTKSKTITTKTKKGLKKEEKREGEEGVDREGDIFTTMNENELKRKVISRASISSLGVSIEWTPEEEKKDVAHFEKKSNSTYSSYSSYKVVKKVIDSSRNYDDDDDDNNNGSNQTIEILANTLYRYAVLLGIPEEMTEDTYSIINSNPIWALLKAVCTTNSITTVSSSLSNSKMIKKKANNCTPSTKSSITALVLTSYDIQVCSAQYQVDQKFANIHSGNNFLLERARRRSETLLTPSSSSSSSSSSF
jgi:uncharacterized protein YerC